MRLLKTKIIKDYNNNDMKNMIMFPQAQIYIVFGYNNLDHYVM